MFQQEPYIFDNQTGFYRGKVRDVYYFGNKVACVATNRISAFDVVLDKPIPYKGQVLNQIAAFFLQMAENQGIKTWLEAVPHPYVSFGKKCEAIPIEIVVRQYLAGHAWREYASGKRVLCGEPLPEGLRENDKLPHVIITPTTKASQGHDQDISKDDAIRLGLVEESVYQKIEDIAFSLFEIGSRHAQSRGLLLVDTKYEFGLYEGEIFLIDEIHTPDSSRYFYAEGYEYRQNYRLEQLQLSKEFVRKWLIAHGFQGLPGQVQPMMDDEFVKNVSLRYIELYQTITGNRFVPCEPNPEEIKKAIESCLQ